MDIVSQVIEQVDQRAEQLGVSQAALYPFKAGYLAGIMAAAIEFMTEEESKRFFPLLKIER